MDAVTNALTSTLNPNSWRKDLIHVLSREPFWISWHPRDKFWMKSLLCEGWWRLDSRESGCVFTWADAQCRLSVVTSLNSFQNLHMTRKLSQAKNVLVKHANSRHWWRHSLFWCYRWVPIGKYRANCSKIPLKVWWRVTCVCVKKKHNTNFKIPFCNFSRVLWHSLKYRLSFRLSMFASHKIIKYKESKY